MANRRKLTDAEREMIRSQELEKAQKAYPGENISVTVADEVDEDGIVRVNTIRIKVGEVTMAPGR